MRCSPFTLKLFDTMIGHSVSLMAIAGSAGLKHQYTQTALAELRAEGELLWLIQVGLLRREVDGQGLTDSFRVTPLGRQIIQRWHDRRSSQFVPSWRDHLSNAINRWLRLPI